MSRKRGNGEGSISYRSKERRWEARYTVHTTKGPKRRSVYGKTRAEAHAKLTKALSELHGGVAFDAENITFGEYLERWLNDSVRDSVKERTLMSYEQRVKKHLVPALGHLKLKKLTPAHLQAFYRSKLDEGHSAQSVLSIHTTTRGALKQATRWGLIRTNPASAVQPPRPKKAEITPFTKEQAKILLGAAQGSRLYALYALALATGLRHGELLGLRWEDVEIKEGEGRLSARDASA